MKQKEKKYTIGVLLYSSVGTKTSILLSEFLFFNKFAELNPGTKFVFIPVTRTIYKKVSKYLHLLEDHVDYDMLLVDKPGELYKLNNNFSGFFSYMLRNNFFGGAMDPRCKMNYIICSYVTNELDKPLFFRLPDSEYNYLDYRKMADTRIKHNTSGPKFLADNKKAVTMLMAWDKINYDNVHWIANGSDKIYDWAPNVLVNNIKPLLLEDGIKESLSRIIYVSDDILFGYHENLNRLKLDAGDNDNKICYAGFLKGSVAEKRPKILKQIFKKNSYKIPTRIFGPGSKDIPEIQNKKNIELIDDSIQGDDFYKFLNKQLAIIHFGKGKENYSYISKSIYDCAIAGVPSLIYLPCDTNRIIFDDDRFYFSNEKELKKLYEKLQSSDIRKEYLDDQREWIENTLSNKMYPHFIFSDHCEEQIYTISKLF
jgi:hypothetical protein